MRIARIIFTLHICLCPRRQRQCNGAFAVLHTSLNSSRQSPRDCHDAWQYRALMHCELRGWRLRGLFILSANQSSEDASLLDSSGTVMPSSFANNPRAFFSISPQCASRSLQRTTHLVVFIKCAGLFAKPVCLHSLSGGKFGAAALHFLHLFHAILMTSSTLVARDDCSELRCRALRNGLRK